LFIPWAFRCDLLADWARRRQTRPGRAPLACLGGCPTLSSLLTSFSAASSLLDATVLGRLETARPQSGRRPLLWGSFLYIVFSLGPPREGPRFRRAVASRTRGLASGEEPGQGSCSPGLENFFPPPPLCLLPPDRAVWKQCGPYPGSHFWAGLCALLHCDTSPERC